MDTRHATVQRRHSHHGISDAQFILSLFSDDLDDKSTRDLARYVDQLLSNSSKSHQRVNTQTTLEDGNTLRIEVIRRERRFEFILSGTSRIPGDLKTGPCEMSFRYTGVLFKSTMQGTLDFSMKALNEGSLRRFAFGPTTINQDVIEAAADSVADEILQDFKQSSIAYFPVSKEGVAITPSNEDKLLLRLAHEVGALVGHEVDIDPSWRSEREVGTVKKPAKKTPKRDGGAVKDSSRRSSVREYSMTVYAVGAQSTILRDAAAGSLLVHVVERQQQSVLQEGYFMGVSTVGARHAGLECVASEPAGFRAGSETPTQIMGQWGLLRIQFMQSVPGLQDMRLIEDSVEITGSDPMDFSGAREIPGSWESLGQLLLSINFDPDAISDVLAHPSGWIVQHR